MTPEDLLGKVHDRPSSVAFVHALAEERELTMAEEHADPRDFELMAELIFSHSGWQRQSWTGGSQRAIDVNLRLPSTGESAFVQVKSETDDSQFDEYASYLAGTEAHACMFYVWHSGAINRKPSSNITLWGPDVIASKVLEAGLLTWLKDRAS